MDRLEYNNTHKYHRHTDRFSDKDEEELSPKEQQRRINKDIPFNVLVNEQIDREITKQVAEELGVTLGYISSALKKADCSIDDYVFKTGTRADIIWHCWNKFVNDWEMPYFLDVELEFVLRNLLGDLLPFTHWLYSMGELLRYILTYYLFDNDKMYEEITEYLKASSDEERTHYEDYYGDQTPIVGAVYIRLCQEIERRKTIGLHDSDKINTNIFAAVEKITKRLNVNVEDFLTKRFYPYVAKWRNKRLRQFYKHYSGKKLPK